MRVDLVGPVNERSAIWGGQTVAPLPGFATSLAFSCRQWRCSRSLPRWPRSDAQLPHLQAYPKRHMAHQIVFCLLIVGASGSNAGPVGDERPSINVIADHPVGAFALGLGGLPGLESHASIAAATAQQQERKMDELLRAGAGRLGRLRASTAEARRLLPGGASIPAGASLRASAPPAETLAGLVDAANKQSAGSEQRGRAFRDAFSSSLGQGGQAGGAVAPSRMAALSGRISDELGGCARDWSAPCPRGWAQGAQLGEATCSSPRGYSGGCATVQSFMGMDEGSRARFAEECDAPWPCASECVGGASFDGCPTGWSDVGGGFCSQTTATPADATCPTILNFSELGAHEQEELSRACLIEWPCKAQPANT